MDYKVYHLTIKEKIKCFGITVLITGIISFLFYNSWWAFLITPVLYVMIYRRIRNVRIAEIQEQLAKEFLDSLRTISASLMAGLSMENAWKEAQKEIGSLHGNRSFMYRELEEMNHSIALNIPIEHLLQDFSERSGNNDIVGFSDIFTFAKRSGGNFITIIQGTSEHMRARFETEREINVLVASRKMEQKIMNIIPVFILGYLKLTSFDFLNILYGNPAGVLFMTVCLAAYGGAMLLAEKIINIRM